MNRSIALVWVPLIASSSLALADDLKRFSADDVFDLEYANDPRISPDGARIVYERRGNDIMTDSTRTNLWIIDADGSGHRPLVSGTASASSPRWSPDGERLAYVKSTDSGTGVARGNTPCASTVMKSTRSIVLGAATPSMAIA